MPNVINTLKQVDSQALATYLAVPIARGLDLQQ